MKTVFTFKNYETSKAARLKCLSFLVSARLQHRTVNLVILSTSETAKPLIQRHFFIDGREAALLHT